MEGIAHRPCLDGPRGRPQHVGLAKVPLHPGEIDKDAGVRLEEADGEPLEGRPGWTSMMIVSREHGTRKASGTSASLYFSLKLTAPLRRFPAARSLVRWAKGPTQIRARP